MLASVIDRARPDLDASGQDLRGEDQVLGWRCRLGPQHHLGEHRVSRGYPADLHHSGACSCQACSQARLRCSRLADEVCAPLPPLITSHSLTTTSRSVILASASRLESADETALPCLPPSPNPRLAADPLCSLLKFGPPKDAKRQATEYTNLTFKNFWVCPPIFI